MVRASDDDLFVRGSLLLQNRSCFLYLLSAMSLLIIAAARTCMGLVAWA